MVRRFSARLRDLDAKSPRGVCQSGVIAVEALQALTDAQDGRQVKGVQRAKLGRAQVGGSFEDPLIQRQECDRGQAGAGASGSQLAVAACRTSSLHDEQGAAEELSADKLAAQRGALGL
jgi:hypothetical protein